MTNGKNNIDINIDLNIKYDLSFINEDIHNEYEKFLKQSTNQHHSTQTWGKKKEKISTKTKLAWILFFLLSFYTFYYKYNNYLIEKETKELLEKEKENQAKQEALKAEQKQQELAIQKDIDNAKKIINNVEPKDTKEKDFFNQIFKEAQLSLEKAHEFLKNKNYSEASLEAKDAIAKANNAVVLYEEKIKEEAKNSSKKSKGTKKAQEVSKKKADGTKVKTDVLKAEEKSEIGKENKMESQKADEQDAKKLEMLKNRVLELVSDLEKEMQDQQSVDKIKRFFPEKNTYITNCQVNIKNSMDSNNYTEAIEIAEKTLKIIKEAKKESEREELAGEEKRKEALQKILDAQKAIKEKRLKEGK